MQDILNELYPHIAATHPGPHAWIGQAPPPGLTFTAIDLHAKPGFRANADQSGHFASVWLAETPVTLQGWRILLDSALRMLKPSGVLVMRYAQNQYISLPALKNFLYRKHGFRVGVLSETIRGNDMLTAFTVERDAATLPTSKTWTFGLLTQGKKVALVERLCRTIREFGGTAHEIIIVGPRNDAYEPYAPVYIDKTYSTQLADICVKKNDIVDRASHENLCILHDRYWLNPDFFSGFDLYGYDFDFITIRQQHQSGKNYPSYCAIDDHKHLIWGPIYECGNENQTWNRHYLNGGLLIAKRALLRRVPFNPLIFHNQAEDVELARQMESHSVVLRINRHASAVTDVPDHMTDAFTLAAETDYDRVFFPPAPPQEPPPSDALATRLRDAIAWLKPHRADRPDSKGIRILGVRLAKPRFLRKKKRAATAPQEVRPRSRLPHQPDERMGLNIILYAADPGGVVNVAIHYMRSLARKGIPFCIVDIERGRGQSVIPADLAARVLLDPIYPTNVWCIGFPFMLDHTNTLHDWANGRWNANFTHWELPFVPKRLARNFDALDSVIVDTEFVRDAIATITSKPIALIDPEIRVPTESVKHYDRRHFGLPTDKVLFLLNWEYTSSTVRKNPQAGLKAFGEAFAGRDDVALVMHVKFESRHGKKLLKEYTDFLSDVRRKHPNVIVLEKNSFSYEEALGLKHACDVYISLHRSEGYGMGCAESLALGRRCVMTGWSGNLEFLKDPHWRPRLYPVPADLIPVTPADFAWVDANDEVSQVWADVRHADAVRALQQAHQDVISDQQGLVRAG
ncbi:MAG TPA: glycosyltransferase [Candidatus Aquabacterium excrementipullorum]|nr:glycosyltransferase [Candidatus Aquabacterium excrementipullorum]